LKNGRVTITLSFKRCKKINPMGVEISIALIYKHSQLTTKYKVILKLPMGHEKLAKFTKKLPRRNAEITRLILPLLDPGLPKLP